MSEFATGVIQVFQQTSAPTGWTKLTTHNDKAIRLVSGNVGTGGNANFTGSFGASISTSGRTLTTNQIPSHTHNWASLKQNTGTANLVYVGGLGNNTGAVATNNNGSNSPTGGSHSHGINMQVQYVDCILAEKD